MGFTIKKVDTKIKKITLKLEGSFIYKIHLDKNNIQEVIIYDANIIDKLILVNFAKRYKKILEYYFWALESEDDSEGSMMVALDEIARLRSIIIRKHHNYLSKKAEEQMFKKLKLLENEIRTKIIDFQLIKEQEKSLEETPSKGR